MLEVYALRVPRKLNSNVFEKLLGHATPSKRRKIRRYRIEADKLRGLFADLLIRAIIMEKTHLQNHQIDFGTNEYGKPYLKGRNDFHFNLSHAGEWVVAAVDIHPVGIDVEEIQDIDLSISNCFFSDDEHHDLMRQADQKNYFFSLWSLKEAYIKIIGKGLSQPLDSFSIRYTEDDQIVASAEGKPLDNVNFIEYELHQDYKMFLAAAHSRFPKDVTMQCANRLIHRFAA